MVNSSVQGDCFVNIGFLEFRRHGRWSLISEFSVILTTGKLIGYTEVSFLYSDALNGSQQLAMLVFSIIDAC